jgi:EGF-like domain
LVTKKIGGIKTYIYLILFACLALGTVIYSSCSKDPCSGVICLNGGSCAAGKCICASGYTGETCRDLATTQIRYHNNTFTPVFISVNGYSSSIPVGGSYYFSGNYGAAAIGAANTVSAAGVSYSWALIDTFPASGILTVPLDVPPAYFYLKVVNNDSLNAGVIITNTGLLDQRTDTVNLPGFGGGYGIGYFDAHDSTQLTIYTGVTAHSFDVAPYLPFSTNQAFIAFVP